MNKLHFKFQKEEKISINTKIYPFLNDHCIFPNKPVIPIAFIISWIINVSKKHLPKGMLCIINDFKVFKSGSINEAQTLNYTLGINITDNKLNIIILNENVPCYGCRVRFEKPQEIIENNIKKPLRFEKTFNDKSIIYSINSVFHGESFQVIGEARYGERFIEIDVISKNIFGPELNLDLSVLDSIFQSCGALMGAMKGVKIIPMESYEIIFFNNITKEKNKLHTTLIKEKNNNYFFNANLVHDDLVIIAKNIKCVKYG